jgi:hypothetical protein
MNSSFKYRAFLTYAHKDEEKARWLRKKLENFRVPKHLIGQNSPFGPIPVGSILFSEIETNLLGRHN